MKASPTAQFSFEIEALDADEGGIIDPVDVTVFESYLNDLLAHADFSFRIGSLVLAGDTPDHPVRTAPPDSITAVTGRIRELAAEIVATRDIIGDYFPDAAELAQLVAEAAAKAARIAPPRPDYTTNQDFTIRAVLPGYPAGHGSLACWYVAAERTHSPDTGNGDWVTWNAYEQDGPHAGLLSYDGGHYFTGTDAARNKRLALADLAVRAGLTSGVGLRIADEIIYYHETDSLASGKAEDLRMARRLRRWCAR